VPGRAPADVTAERVVRVFVSSTFRDMQAERDELVKRTFPQLRKLCESRGVTWSEVDLRWGVTDEQKAEGKVLPICLQEIARCRPYFLGLLGERYGWTPDALDPALVEQERWLAEQAGKSVTELEILHGVLNNPAMADHAFFYLRDPSYVEGKPPEQYRECATPDEVAILGAEEAERRAARRRAKLGALKTRIRESGLPVRDGYGDPRTLGEAVLADLSAVIEHVYPTGSEPDPLAREAAEHEAFAASRAAVYIGRADYFSRLDAHAAGNGAPLVVLGESGSGKSALLANWARSYRAANAGDFVLMHFIGASAASADWAAMLRRILAELERGFELQLEIPDRPDALRLAFANALHMAAAKGRVVLVLDALNQLDDREGAPDLVWLPPEIPSNVRLLLSTMPGRPLEEAGKRGWPTLRIEPLQADEREQLIVGYLAEYTKALDPGRRVRVAGAPQTANPLFLRALLDELRLWGAHETLDARISHYLAAPTVDSLYERILARYEEDYERDRPGLVGEAFSLLWAARRGLSETELLDLLAADGNPVPRAYWSPLLLAAESSLTSRSGLLGFFHEFLRRAVEGRYLKSKEDWVAAHRRLADYFAMDRLSPRAVDELPWQLAESSAWQGLCDLLADPEFFHAGWQEGAFEIKRGWARVEGGSTLRMVDAYHRVLDEAADHPTRHVWRVATLLADAGHPEQALVLRAHLVERYRQDGDLSSLQAALGANAATHRARGDLEEAMALWKEQERICRELGEPAGLAASLSNQAVILRDRDLDAAMTLLTESQHISRELGDKAILANSLENQGLILQARGDLEGAMALHKEGERISRELGDKAGLASSLGNQGLILQARGDLEGAMALYKEQDQVCRELGDKAGLAISLLNQAANLGDRGDLGGAMALHKEGERISRELGDKAGLAISLGNQGLILRDRGDLEEAMALHKEGERISRELGNKAGLAISLGNQGLILRDRGDLEGAMALLKEQERICRELGDRPSLSRSIGHQAVILRRGGDLEGAMALYKEHGRICRELGDAAGLARSLANQAAVLANTGRSREALPLLDEALNTAGAARLTALAQQIQSMHDKVRGLDIDTTGARGLSDNREGGITQLTHPKHYEVTAWAAPGERRQLSLVRAATDGALVTLVYRWGSELSSQEADRLDTRARAFVACAIYDAAIAAGLQCDPGPTHGSRPAWRILGETTPVSLIGAGFDVADRTCFMRVGPVAVSRGQSPVLRCAAALVDGFESTFSSMTV
jgi:tetratricopeptide (TPR) repeat protein